MKNYGDNRGECYRPGWIKASGFCIIHISIYTPSDLVDLSNLIGALSIAHVAKLTQSKFGLEE